MADKQFLIFRLEEDFYGAEIHNIQEIIFPQRPVKVPNNPDFIEGIIDYRDEIVPVIDLNKRFNLGISDYGEDSRFIIAEVGKKKVAFVVDEVTEIIRVNEEQLGKVPEITKIKKDYIRSVVRRDEGLIVILDLAKVLTIEEIDIIENALEK